jgi:hypothetical protein
MDPQRQSSQHLQAGFFVCVCVTKQKIIVNTHIGNENFGVQRTLNAETIQKFLTQTVRVKIHIFVIIHITVTARPKNAEDGTSNCD